MTKDNIQIIERQPNDLNSVGNLRTMNQLISGDGLRKPTIIPDVTADKARLESQGITIERVNIATLDNNEQTLFLLQVAKVYGDVFAGPPWNEKPDPVNVRAGLIAEDLARPDAQFLVVRTSDGEIKGFTLSYTTTPRQLVEEKWETEAMQEKILKTLAKLKIEPDEPITYFAEAGIDPELRGLGISRIFYGERLKGAKDLRYPVLVRTRKDTKIPFLTDEFGFVPIFGAFTEVVRRDSEKAIANRLNTFYEGVDDENPDRLLLALKGSR